MGINLLLISRYITLFQLERWLSRVYIGARPLAGRTGARVSAGTFGACRLSVAARLAALQRCITARTAPACSSRIARTAAATSRGLSPRRTAAIFAA